MFNAVLQEVAWGLTGLPLRGSSRSTVKVGVGDPENRVGILTTSTMQAAAAGGGAGGEEEEVEGEEEGGEGGGSALALGLHAYYAARPPQLEHLTLYQFASTKEVSSRARQGSLPINIQSAARHVHARSTPAVVRVYPRMSFEAHGDEYYYAMLQLHVPWRNEQQQFPRQPEGALERMFLLHRPSMQRQLDHAAMADDMAATVARLAALGSQEHGYGGVAAGGQERERMAAEEEARVGGRGIDAEWGALDPGERMLEMGEVVRGEEVQGGGGEDGEVEAALRDALASAGQGRMAKAQFREVQQQSQGEQRTVYDAVRHHIRDTQRAHAAAISGSRWVSIVQYGKVLVEVAVQILCAALCVFNCTALGMLLDCW